MATAPVASQPPSRQSGNARRRAHDQGRDVRPAGDFNTSPAGARSSASSPLTTSAKTAGTINPIIRKRHLGDHYKPRTIRHSNAVVGSFYEFWIEGVDFCVGHVGDVRCAVVYEKSHSMVDCEYVWRRADLWINFPWSTLPPVVSRDGQVLDA